MRSYVPLHDEMANAQQHWNVTGQCQLALRPRLDEEIISSVAGLVINLTREILINALCNPEGVTISVGFHRRRRLISRPNRLNRFAIKRVAYGKRWAFVILSTIVHRAFIISRVLLTCTSFVITSFGGPRDVMHQRLSIVLTHSVRPLHSSCACCMLCFDICNLPSVYYFL